MQANDSGQPHEDPNALLRQAFGVASDLEKLIVQINTTNMKTKLPDGRTLTEAIARRDTLVLEHALLVAAIAGTHKEPERYSSREIKWVATLAVPKLQKQLEDLAKTLRELNGAIQETNWKAVLCGLKEGLRVRVGRRHPGLGRRKYTCRPWL